MKDNDFHNFLSNSILLKLFYVDRVCQFEAKFQVLWFCDVNMFITLMAIHFQGNDPSFAMHTAIQDFFA